MPDKSTGLSRFWKELRRRNVLRSLAIYAGSAFIILEATTIIFPRWNFPDWSIDLVLWLLILGTFINVIIAWFYDITPRGMQKTLSLEKIHDQEKAPPSKGWKAATYISVVVIVGLILLNIVGGRNQLRAGDIQSIVILPFDNFTGDDELEYFVAGMHASLINDLGKLSGLRVICKTSASAYKDLDLTASEIARELNVNAVVEGSIMCLNDSICSQFRLVNTLGEEKQIWTADYKEDRSQILNFYNQITRQIADEILIELTPEEESWLTESRTVDKQAYEAYLKGLYYWDQFTPEALQLAVEHFQKAIEADPAWAEPYAGVAYYWIAIRQFGIAPNSVTVPKIYESLNEASRLDPNSTFTLYVSALASVWTGFNWEKGEKELLKVIEVNPNDAFARIYYAHLLMLLKRDHESVKQGQLAADLDPLNPMIQALYAMALAFMDFPDRAIQHAEKALSLAPENYAALSALTIAYIYKKDFEKSLEAWLEYLPVDEDNRNSILNLFNTHGFDAAIKKYAEEAEKIGMIPPIDLVNLYAYLGDYPKAMDLIEQSYEDHNANTPYIGSNCFKEGPFMIDDPRLDSLLIEMNLPLSTSN